PGLRERVRPQPGFNAAHAGHEHHVVPNGNTPTRLGVHPGSLSRNRWRKRRTFGLYARTGCCRFAGLEPGVRDFGGRGDHSGHGDHTPKLRERSGLGCRDGSTSKAEYHACREQQRSPTSKRARQHSAHTMQGHGPRLIIGASGRPSSSALKQPVQGARAGVVEPDADGSLSYQSGYLAVRRLPCKITPGRRSTTPREQTTRASPTAAFLASATAPDTWAVSLWIFPIQSPQLPFSRPRCGAVEPDGIAKRTRCTSPETTTLAGSNPIRNSART